MPIQTWLRRHPRRLTTRTRGVRQLTAGLATALAIAAVSAAPASADGLFSAFDLVPGSTLAGAHGDVTLDFSVARTDGSESGGLPEAKGLIRNLEAQMPPGVVGNPRLPTCSATEMASREGYCPEKTQVGVITYKYQAGWEFEGAPQGIATNSMPLFNLERRPGQLARFGFSPGGIAVVTMDFRLREESDSGITAVISNLPSPFGMTDVSATFWGVPADPANDDWRVADDDFETGGACFSIGGGFHSPEGCPSAEPRRAFLANPTRCDAPVTAGLQADFWGAPGVFSTRTSAPLSFSDCAAVPFDASLAVDPDSTVAGAPSGYAVDLKVPRAEDDDPDGRSASAVKTVTVTMPEGVAISPSAADGLSSCSDEQLGFGTRNAPRCPESSKVGRVTVDSPLVDEPLQGSLYIGTQLSDDPESGEMYRVLLVAEGSGARFKLRGSIKADPKTGQLTATFADNPELPFDRMQLRFMGGERAPLTNPSTCGEHTTKYEITSWSGRTVAGSDSFTVDQDCSTGRFAPRFEAGTLDPAAGRFSPFTFTVRRDQGDQPLAGIAVDLPSGLLASLGSVPLCPEEQAAAGTCGAESRVGRTTISAGAGGHPFTLGGDVSLGGPYKGAPFSLSIAVDAKAGPFDLGKVVVRSPLTVDAGNAKASAPADPLPTILGGVPLDIRTVNITLDRPGFTFNATDCTPRAVTARFTSLAGATAYASSPYQASGCANLPLDPKLAMTYTGGPAELKKLRNPGLEAELSQTPGQSGLKTVRVTLPAGVGLDIRHTKDDRICLPEQAAARACPASAIVGQIEAETIALHEPLKGTIYIVKNTRTLPDGRVMTVLPKLYMKLDGEGVPLDLMGTTSFANSGGQLTTTFDTVPDAPIRRMHLKIDGGSRGILRANTDICASPKGTRVSYDGQNGARRTRTLHVTAPDCRPAIAEAKIGPTAVTVRVSGIGGGRLSAKGSGLRSATRRISESDAATVKPRLSAGARRTLAHGKPVKLGLTVTYAPSAAGQKTITLRKTLTVKPAKRSSR